MTLGGWPGPASGVVSPLLGALGRAVVAPTVRARCIALRIVFACEGVRRLQSIGGPPVEF